MAFIRGKTGPGGRRYYQLVECRRDGPGGAPRQHVLEYVGTAEALGALALAGRGEASEAAARAIAREGIAPAASPAPPGGAPAAAGPASFRCYEHGASSSLWAAAGLVGLEGILDDAFPAKTVKGLTRGRVLALECVHRAVDPGSKAAFSGWLAHTTLPHSLSVDATSLDSRAVWEAMDGIGEAEIDAAQRAIVSRLGELFPGELGTLQLDYTNYHTWIDTRNGRCVICQRGHSKQKRSDLRQFALAMLTARSLPVPLVWELYEGNRNDKSEFPAFAEKVARELGGDLSDVTVSFDGGGNSAEALSSLPFHFVCAHSLAGHKGLLDIPLAEYAEVDLGGGRTRLARRVDGLEFSGVTGTGVLTLSEDLRRGQEAELARKEARLGKRAETLRGRLANPRSTLFGKLRKAEREASQRELAVKGHNADVERARAEGRGAGMRRRPAPAPFDELAAMRSIVEAELFRGLACLRGFWSCEVSRDGEGGAAAWSLSVSRDDAARAAHCDRDFGKKLTVTNRTDWGTAEILAAYSDQEGVEDLFRTTKRTDHFSVRPQYHWTDQKIRVHVFLCLCSVMLAEVLRRLAADAGADMSKAALLDTLAHVHAGWVYVGDAATWATEELGGQERSVWEAVRSVPELGLGG